MSPLSDSRQPRIALTYDDGPTEHTEELLDVLAAAGAGATFFVTGESVEARPEVLRRIAADPRMEIGGHSLTHPDLRTVSDEQARAEVVECQELVEKVSGRSVRLYRPPSGQADARTRRWTSESGQAIVMWTVSSLDWLHQSAQKTASIVTRSPRDGDIVLLHDSQGSTVRGTELILQALTRRGFRFVTVSELLGPMVPGETYRGRLGAARTFTRRVRGKFERERELRRQGA